VEPESHLFSNTQVAPTIKLLCATIVQRRHAGDLWFPTTVREGAAAGEAPGGSGGIFLGNLEHAGGV
jgi:hypothetical protein